MRRLFWVVLLVVLGVLLYQRRGIPVPEVIGLPGGETEVRLSFLKWPEFKQYVTSGEMPARPPAEAGVPLFRM